MPFGPDRTGQIEVFPVPSWGMEIELYTATTTQIPCNQHSWRAAESVCARCERPMCSLCAVGLVCKPCAQERRPSTSVPEAAGALVEAGVAGLVSAFIASFLLWLVLLGVAAIIPEIGVLALLSPIVVGGIVAQTVSLVARGRVSSFLRMVAALDVLVAVLGSRFLEAYLYTGDAGNALGPLFYVAAFFACLTALVASGRVKTR
jgi:hypothetical protein